MHSFDLAVLNNELMMDSRDIANMTGKKHFHVIRDIENMQSKLTNPKLVWLKYKDNKGEMRTCARLPYRELMVLLTGYSVELRSAIIDRWLYLEKEYKQKRVKSIEARNTFTDTLKEHGYTKAHQYIQTTKQMKNKLGITNSKENMSTKELKRIAASEALASAMLDDEYGYSEVNPVCIEASEVVQAAVQRKVLTA